MSTFVYLSEVVKIRNGYAFAASTFQNEGVPVIRMSDLKNFVVDVENAAKVARHFLKDLPAYKLEKGDLIIGMSGSIGKVAVYQSHNPALQNQRVGVFKIHDTKRIDRNYLKFLSYTFESKLLELGKGVGVKNISAEDIEALLIPLPPLPEQKRIAAILEKADRVRHLRRYALELSETYLQVVFLEMFATNTGIHWPNENIESLALEKKGAIRTGPFGSQLLHSEFVDEGIAVLGIDNAVQNRFDWGARRFITEEKYQELKRYKVFPGDVIITIMGTPGRCAVIPENIPLAINTKHLCCITLDQSKCLPTYLKFCFLTHPSVLRQLNISERGAVMPGLNMEIIRELVVPCPPLTLQQKFTEIVQKFERIQAQQREALRQAEHLFQTLVHKAFQGELSLDEGEMVLPDVEMMDRQTLGMADVTGPIDMDAYQLALPLE